MKEVFFLVTTLIDRDGNDGVIDSYTLFRKLEDAEEQMKREIAICREHFSGCELLTFADYPRYIEERNEEGEGYQVSIVDLPAL